MTSHEHHGASNYRQLDRLFNGLFKLTRKHPNTTSLALVRESGFHAQKISSEECVTMSWSHHGYTNRCQHEAISLRWRHNGDDIVSNHQPYDCLLNCLFRRRSKKTSKLCVTGLCGGNSPVSGEFPAQRASNAENVSIWWRRRWVLHVFIGSSW